MAETLDAKTSLFNLYSVLVILVCLTDWISFIPNAVLATVVIVNLFTSFTVLPTRWRCSPTDFWTFVCTVVMALIASIVASLLLLWLALRTVHPRSVSPLESLEGQEKWKEEGSNTLLNRDSLVKNMEKAIAAVEKAEKDVQILIVNLRRTSFVDGSGMNALHAILCIDIKRRTCILF